MGFSKVGIGNKHRDKSNPTKMKHKDMKQVIYTFKQECGLEEQTSKLLVFPFK